MATTSGSREKVFTNTDEILEIVLDNNDESGNDLDIGGSDIDNNSSDSEFKYEYEPLPQRKPQQAEIQHLESTPEYVKTPLLNTPNVSVIDTENNDNEARNSNSTDKRTNSGRQQTFSDGDCATSSVDTQNNQGVEYESETEYQSKDSNDSDIISAPVAKRIRGGATRPGRRVGSRGRGGIKQRGGRQPQNRENPVGNAANEVIRGQGRGRGARRGANRERAVGNRQRNPVANWEKMEKGDTISKNFLSMKLKVVIIE